MTIDYLFKAVAITLKVAIRMDFVPHLLLTYLAVNEILLLGNITN